LVVINLVPHKVANTDELFVKKIASAVYDDHMTSDLYNPSHLNLNSAKIHPSFYKTVSSVIFVNTDKDNFLEDGVAKFNGKFKIQSVN